MRNIFKLALSIGLMLGVLYCVSATAQAPGVAPGDCVVVQNINTVFMSLAGTQVAYLVKSPSLDKNINEYQLYVRDVSDASRSNGRLLVSGDEMSSFQWIDNDRRVAMLISMEGIKKLFLVDVKTSASGLAFPADESIDDFKMDAAGNTIVYSVSDMPNTIGATIKKQDVPEYTKAQISNGYRIDFKKRDPFERATTKAFYIRHRDASGTWSEPQLVVWENPFTHVKISHPTYPQQLSMSPDGKKITIQLFLNGFPEDWRENRYFQYYKSIGYGRILPFAVLFDVDSGKTSLAFKIIQPTTTPVWTRDSQSFFINASSPVGSQWEAEELRENSGESLAEFSGQMNLFRVNVATGTVDEVLKNTLYDTPPLFLFPNGDVWVQGRKKFFMRLHESKDGWQEADRVSIPKKVEDMFYHLTTNGDEIFGVHETVTSPEALFKYKPGQTQISLLTNFTAQFGALRSASVRRIQWTTMDGLNVTGLLFLPPDYVPGKRYPLVIETKRDDGWFNCDYGPGHFPSFAPQPIASAGIMYLARTGYGEDFDQKAEADHEPKGYPGEIGGVVETMDIWDSAVETLSKQGLVDDSKVGIIGFSRTGSEVEFDLFRSRIHYAAATVTDNIQYDLNEYWLIPTAAVSDEARFGGPPFGKTLENWQKYSLSYNFEKVHTPLLMEELGYGIPGNLGLWNEVPAMVAPYLEITTSLTRLNKPFEMYYYPNDVHQIDHPRGREASMQRNVDWYRFWLQGYERPNPEDPDQYKRWEHLRELRDTDAKAAKEEPQTGHAN